MRSSYDIPLNSNSIVIQENFATEPLLFMNLTMTLILCIIQKFQYNYLHAGWTFLTLCLIHQGSIEQTKFYYKVILYYLIWII